MGDPKRAVAQRAQRPDQRPRHQDDEQQRQQDRAEHDRRVADRLGARGGGFGLDRAGHRGHRRVDHLGGDLVGRLQRRRQVRVVDQRDGRVGDDCRPPDVLGLQLLGLRRADAEHLAHAEQRRRLGTGEGDHARALLGLGQLGAQVDQQLLHHHLTAGADGAGQALRLGADALVVDANRAGDRVLGGQQDRRVERDPVDQADGVRRDLVQQRLAAVEHARDALSDVGRDVGRVVEPTLQLRAAGVEGAHRGLRVATGRRRQDRAVERGHVANDRGHHFGAVGGALQITGFDRVRVDAQPAEGAGQNQRHQDDRKHLPADRPILQRPSGRTFGCEREPRHRRRRPSRPRGLAA